MCYYVTSPAFHHGSESKTNFDFSAPDDQRFGHVMWVQADSGSCQKTLNMELDAEWLGFFLWQMKKVFLNLAPRPAQDFHSVKLRSKS